MSKVPAGDTATMVPTPVGDPSPQSIVAVKSLAGSEVLELLKTPTVEVACSGRPVSAARAGAVPGVSPVAVMTACPAAMAVAPETVFVIVTVTGHVPTLA